MDNLGVIYKIENLVTSKVYIGQTTRDFHARKSQHLYELRNDKKRNRKLQDSWKKHGESNFKFEVIENCPIQLLDDKEIFYIAKYDSFQNGYNMTTGGNQVMHSQHHTKEARKKMSMALKSRWSDSDFRKKMEERPVYKGNKSPRATKVICLNDQKVFDSMIEASKYYGISMKKVSQVCCGKSKYTGLEETGRKLQFARYSESKVYKLKDYKHKNEKRLVVCLNTGEVYSSMREASIKTGAHASSIAHVCHGRRNYAGLSSSGEKLRWQFSD